MIVMSLPLFAGWMFIIFASDVTMLYIGRLLTGFAIGSFSVRRLSQSHSTYSTRERICITTLKIFTIDPSTLSSGDSTDLHRRDRVSFDSRQAGNDVPGFRRFWNIPHVRDRELLPVEDARHPLFRRPVLHHRRPLLPEGLPRVLHAARATRVGQEGHGLASQHRRHRR